MLTRVRDAMEGFLGQVGEVALRVLEPIQPLLLAMLLVGALFGLLSAGLRW